MKSRAILLLLLPLCACGQGTTPQAGSSAAGSTDVGSEAAVSSNPDMTEFAHEVDANGDGKLSRAEWEAKGLPDTSFNGFEKGRGYVTLEDYRNNPAPPGIDLNGDGKLTVEEFKEFDKQMAAKGPPPRAGKQGD